MARLGTTYTFKSLRFVLNVNNSLGLGSSFTSLQIRHGTPSPLLSESCLSSCVGRVERLARRGTSRWPIVKTAEQLIWRCGVSPPAFLSSKSQRLGSPAERTVSSASAVTVTRWPCDAGVDGELVTERAFTVAWKKCVCL